LLERVDMTIVADGRLGSGTLDRIAAKPLFVASVFFVSGFPALLYQLTWQRSLFAIYGINVEAVTVVVAGFLFGLGIGSLMGGRLSRVTGFPLLALFGAIEISIGIFGVLSLHLFALVGAHTLFLPMAGTTLAVLGLLFVPTLLMGSTLPILTAYLLRRAPSVGGSVGLLYCVNTAGSATACFACAFGLMRLTGMQGEVDLAAAINFAIGIAALAEAWRTRARDAGAAAPASAIAVRNAAPDMPFSLAWAVGLAAIVGYLSLSYEIIWFRAFVLASNTAAAFAIVLGAYLAGIANGSLRARRLFDRPFSRRRAAVIVAGAVFAGSMLGFFLLPITAAAAFAGLGYVYPMLLLVFAQASVFGCLFPIICHCSIVSDRGAGARVSRVYLGNIVGSVAGTLATGFFLMDHLSMAALSLWVALFGVAIALAFGLAATSGARSRLAVVAAAIAAAAVLTAIDRPLFGQVY
jgi:spermidine synthase